MGVGAGWSLDRGEITKKKLEKEKECFILNAEVDRLLAQLLENVRDVSP